MKKTLLLVLFLLLAINAFAYDGSPEQQVESFFKDLSAGKSSEAIDNLFSSNPVVSQKAQQITMLKQQITMIDSLYGKSMGQENFVVEQTTPSITRIVKIDKHKLHPIVWEFYFYKPQDKWIISQGVFNDQFQFLKKK